MITKFMKMYIFISFRIVNILQRVLFFLQKSDYKYDIYFIQQFNKQEVNIKRLKLIGEDEQRSEYEEYQTLSCP